jgi:hypothetical protein
MSQTREKFATQVKPEILAAVRALAEAEGRLPQALVDEALTDLIEKHKNAQPRACHGSVSRQPRKIRFSL